jgi:hypothetical protein
MPFDRFASWERLKKISTIAIAEMKIVDFFSDG